MAFGGKMQVIGVDGLTREQIQHEVLKGGRFVIYPWCVSVILMSFKRSSDVYFVPAGQRFTVPGLGYLLLSLLGGWWGVPWGPIWTVQCLWTHATGGHDVTPEILGQTTAAATK
jgi:hypothetical protein